MAAIATLGFSSCQADKDPVFTEATEFVLNTPPFADQLYQLTSNTVLELTCSQPNYGMALAPAYSIDVSLLENFGEGLPEPAEGEAPYYASVLVNNPQSAVIEMDEKNLAIAMCQLMDINEDNYLEKEIPVVPLYIRATASINNQPSTTITSNTIVLKQVLTYYQPEAVSLDVIYNPGNSNGWNFEKCQQLLAYEENKYYGFIYVDGDFKFTAVPGWDDAAGNWGLDGDNPEVGKLVNNGNNIPEPPETGKGLYFAEVNTKDLTYKLTYISSVGVVGDYNGWDLPTAGHMTPSDDYLKWTFEGSITDGFKFVFNESWDINLGGTPNNLVLFNGENLTGTGAATITLDLSTLPYTMTME